MNKIKIEGKEYPMLLGRSALRMFARYYKMGDVGNQKLTEVLGEISMNQADYLNYCSLKAGSAQEGIEFPYTFEQFQELLDNNPNLVDELDRVAQEQAPQEEDDKKKGGKKANQ